LGDLPYYRSNFRRIIAIRKQLSRDLEELGFEVLPSETNFIFARPLRLPAKDWLQRLRERKLLVRWFDAPLVRNHLRISIGTPAEARALVAAARGILGSACEKC
jgi:histidinol-phosphate aminotransferase